MDKTLKSMLAACQKGDSGAQYHLFSQYKSFLFSVCLRYARDRPEAEDMLQDAFLVVFRDLGQFKGEGPFEAWLRKVTVRVALQQLRRKNPLRFAEDYADLSPGSIEYTPDQSFQAEHILTMVQQLPNGYRVVFNMHCIEGYSYPEIATELGIHESSVRSQYARACKQLRAMLDSALAA